MNSSWKYGVACLMILLVAGLALMLSPVRAVLGAAQVGSGFPKHTVTATDGTHLVVTDNQIGKVYFYAIDQGGKPGDELKLRGTIDLNEVGKPAIKPTKEK